MVFFLIWCSTLNIVKCGGVCHFSGIVKKHFVKMTLYSTTKIIALQAHNNHVVVNNNALLLNTHHVIVNNNAYY